MTAPAPGSVFLRIRKFTPYSEAVLWLPVIIGAYYFSSWILFSYTGGDQIFYRAYYKAIAGVGLAQAYSLQSDMVGSAEPAFAFIMWVGSNLGIPKDSYISILNTVLVGSAIYALRSFRVHPALVLMTLSNFYFLVLLTGAERLKISYLLLFLAIATTGGWRWFFILAAPMAHFQTLLNYAALISSRLLDMAKNLRSERPFMVLVSATAVLVVAVSLVGVMFPNMFSNITYKIEYYITRNQRGFSGFTNAVLLVVVGLVVTRRSVQFLMMMAPLFVALSLIGPDRTNMVIYTMFFLFLMLEGRVNHPLVYLPAGYLSFKSVGFVTAILQFGHGFAAP